MKYDRLRFEILDLARRMDERAISNASYKKHATFWKHVAYTLRHDIQEALKRVDQVRFFEEKEDS